jgi:hypothetical protein
LDVLLLLLLLIVAVCVKHVAQGNDELNRVAEAAADNTM